MAISSVSNSSAVSNVSAPTRGSGSTGADARSATSTVVVSKVTIDNPDGTVTIITTYADGHTETDTTAGTKDSAKSNSAKSNSAGSGGGKAGGAAAPAPGGSAAPSADAASGDATAPGIVNTAQARVNLLV